MHMVAAGARTRPLRCCAIRVPSSDSRRLRNRVIYGIRVQGVNQNQRTKWVAVFQERVR